MPFTPGEQPDPGKPWIPGVSGNPNGRPRKFVNSYKASAYKVSEVTDCIQSLVTMTEDELNIVAVDRYSTALEKVVSGAILESIKKKSLFNIETLLSRCFGRPVQSMDITSKGEVLQAVTQILIQPVADQITIQEGE